MDADRSVTPEMPADLSEELVPLYHLERSLGNVVLRIDRDVWTKCPLAVVFRDPIHFEQAAAIVLPDSVIRWESRDPHYEVEAGWSCAKTCHTLSGPIISQ